MSDGELKKRILEDYCGCSFKKMSNCKDWTCTNQSCYELFNIINEAKKEFPETWIDPRGKTLQKNYEESILRFQEIEEYKQKWFGDSK